ncbi:YheC/YheD family protein [Acinetobacter rudis]|uniref:ATP-grasp domain-containing protein n=1 Tax=Acinetobacter rudis CIP 110305 TaxID=421052 RepID=S3PLP6_9GAMM|nr:YheC/YheD family protein [Acinetobacter rudis]EPF79741.1 hypothetical protein F945_00629 [Acinetobacter rudis CIP 110305]
MGNNIIKVGMLRSSGKPASRARAMSYVGQHTGVDIYFFSVDDVDIETRKINAKRFFNSSWVTEVIDYPLIIDNDNNSSMKNKNVINQLSEYCYLTTQVLGGKLKTLNLLRDNNIFRECLIPQEVIRNRDDFTSFLELYDYSVLKPIRGNQGKEIYFIKKNNNKFYVNFEGETKEIASLDNFYDQVIRGRNFIIQKYIESTTIHGAPFDIRVHVQRNGQNKWVNTKTYVRVGTSEGMTANIATGGGIANVISFIKSRYKEKANDVLRKLNELTNHLPTQFQQFYSQDIDALGIDLGGDADGNLWIFEINSFPGTQFFELDEAIIRIEYLKYLHDREIGKKNNLVNLYNLNELWDSNLVIDSQINNNKKNVAVLRSSHSKVGVTEKFIKEHDDNIEFIICDEKPIIDFPENKIILLKDKEKEIMSVSLEKRQKYKPFVYSIIGSVGKTSVLALLGRSLRRIDKNAYINDFGNTPFYVAKGILSAPINSKSWVFEVAGASSFRDEPISVHSHQMLQPNVCIFTNIAEAHVGEIGSLEDVAILKSKALVNIPNNSIVVLNGDMPYQKLIRENVNPLASIYTYGESEKADFQLLDTSEPVLKFNYKDNIYEIDIPADLSLEIKLNFLAVAAALFLTQVDWIIASKYFSDWKPVKGRGNLETKFIENKKLTIINDAYNANPTSMRLAISNLEKRSHSGRKLVVLGEISELGDHSFRIHKELLNFVSIAKIDQVIVIGSLYLEHQNYYMDDIVFYENLTDFEENISKIVEDNDLILFKGSHSSLLYNFLNNL